MVSRVAVWGRAELVFRSRPVCWLSVLGLLFVLSVLFIFRFFLLNLENRNEIDKDVNVR